MSRLILLAILAFSGFSLVAQNGQPNFRGARSLAMGQTGIAFRDINAALNNQAGLAFLPGFSAIASGESRFAMSELKSVSAAAALPTNSGTFGLQVRYFGFEGYNEQLAGLSYALKLAPSISLGAQFDVLRTDIPEYGTANNFTFELGVLAELLPGLWLGGHLFSPVRQEIGESEDFIPTLVNVGLGFRPTEKLLLQAEVEKDIEYDASVRVGVDYYPIEILAIRAGISTAPNLAGFGLGLEIGDGFRIDAAGNYHQVLGFTPAFTLAWQPRKTPTE